MQASASTTTKVVRHSPAFLGAMREDPDGALAHMLLSAFGVSLEALIAMANAALAAKDAKVLLLALTAGVQIRGNVTFVGREYAPLAEKYPDLIIEGTRDVGDQFNFGALHALGHVFANLEMNGLGEKILKKAGCCITGRYASETVAGKVNQEIYTSWTAADKEAWSKWAPTKEQRDWVSGQADLVSSKASKFRQAVAGPPAARPAARPSLAAPGPAATPATAKGPAAPAPASGTTSDKAKASGPV